MNAILKESVYGKGTQRQVDLMAYLGGMNDEETTMFNLLHKGKTETFICGEMHLSSHNSYERIESAVRAKLLIAVFACINYAEDHMTKE